MSKPEALLRICATCLESGGAAAAASLTARIDAAGLSARVTVVEQACFNACAAPQAVSLQGEGRATYLFSGVDLEADAADILATLNAYLHASHGWIEDATVCGRLRFCLLGRVPAL